MVAGIEVKGATVSEYYDPHSRTNQAVLAEVQQQYPGMTVREMMQHRDCALQTIRRSLENNGCKLPQSDVELMQLLHESHLRNKLAIADAQHTLNRRLGTYHRIKKLNAPKFMLAEQMKLVWKAKHRLGRLKRRI